MVVTLRRRSPDSARKTLKATAAPTTPMGHFNDGWVSSQVRELFGTACSPNYEPTVSHADTTVPRSLCCLLRALVAVRTLLAYGFSKSKNSCSASSFFAAVAGACLFVRCSR